MSRPTEFALAVLAATISLLALLASLSDVRQVNVASADDVRAQVALSRMREELNDLSRRIVELRLLAERERFPRSASPQQGRDMEAMTRRIDLLEDRIGRDVRLVTPGEEDDFQDVIFTSSYYRGVILSDSSMRLRSEAFLRLAWLNDGSAFLADLSPVWIRDMLSCTYSGDQLRLSLAAFQLPRSPAVESVLLDTFRFASDDRVRQNALAALSQYETEAARAAIREGTRDPSARVRSEAVDRLMR